MRGESSTPKRPKARRACDACRLNKLKCSYISETDPPICQHCHLVGIPCEAVKPARMDKRRLQQLVDRAQSTEDRQWILQQVQERGLYTTKSDFSSLAVSRTPNTIKAQDLLGQLHDEPGEQLYPPRLEDSQPPQPTLPVPDSSARLKITAVEPRMQGSTATISILEDVEDESAVAAHRQRYGVFRLGDDWVLTGNVSDPIADEAMAMQQLRDDVRDQLVEIYRTMIAPINPVIPPHRVMDVARGSALVMYAMLAIASLDRRTPASLFLTVRQKFRQSRMECADNGSTLSQVQAYLVSGMSHEIHGETNMEGGSIAWLNIGAAIRQAQDLGLHRLKLRHWSPEMYRDRSRAWLGCVVADRCYAVAYGQPLVVDLLDCEDPLGNEEAFNPPDHDRIFQLHLFNFSDIMGRILQTFYRRDALSRCTTEQVEALLRDLDHRIGELPELVSFTGQSTSPQGALLNLLITCTEVLFFRPFLRYRRNVPAHLSFQVRSARWYSVVQRSKAVMAWMDARGDLLLDCWLFTKVAVAYCALALYYHCIATRDAESLRMLGTARDLMRRWAQTPNTSRPKPSRAKIADLVDVLFDAAAKSSPHLDVIPQRAIQNPSEAAPNYFLADVAPHPSEATLSFDPDRMFGVDLTLDDVLGELLEFT